MDELIRCVDEFLSRAERERPVLVLTGCRRCGKTTALEQIRRQLEAIGLPHAMDDYATLPARTPELLTTLMFGLNRNSAYGRLSFRRLLVGLIVMPPPDSARPMPLDQRDPARARERIRQELEKYRDIDRLRTFLGRLGGHLVALAPHMANTGLNDLIGTLLEGLLMRGVLGTRLGRKVLLGPGIDWYGHQDRGLSLEPLDTLVELNRRAAGMDDGLNEANRQWVARLLWGAFLADLDASFAGHDNWDRNCAVLIDNADASAGLTFVAELGEALAMRRENGLADPPLTVIAASREELVRRALPLGGKAVGVRDAGLADYRRRLAGDGAARPGWYTVALPNLTEIETRNLIANRGPITDSRGQATNELLAPVIFTFTGGHPEATHVLVAELTGSADPADLATVLTKDMESVHPPGGGRPPSVEDWLVASLTAGLSDSDVSDLATCSAARDQADANRIDTESDLLTGMRAARGDLFARELWGDPPAGDLATGDPARAGSVVMVPVLRRLLLRRLAGAWDAWDAVFGWLRWASSGDAELYYTLALDDVEFVARGLAASLSPRMTEDDAIGWLARWHAVTAAPRRDSGSAVARRDRPADGVQVIPELVGWADPGDELLASVAALVAARWLLANSLRAGDLRALCREIAANLDTAARFAGAGRDVFRTQAETYRRRPES